MPRLIILVLGLALVGCHRSSSTDQPGPTDAELRVATLAISDFVGEPDSVGQVRLHHTLQARTAQFPDSATWTTSPHLSWNY